MADHRISHIELDDATIIWRSADIEQERRIAIFDLIEENTFKPVRAASAGLAGPWRLFLSVMEGRLVMEIRDEAEELIETLMLGLAAHGIGSCPQTALSFLCDEVRSEAGIDPSWKLLFGVSFGYEDTAAPANECRLGRAALEDSVRFVS